MSNDTELIKSLLLTPSTQFVVTDKIRNRRFTPETTGFISTSNIRSGGSDNLIAESSCVLLKVGKKGKSRLETNIFYFPVFLFDNKEFKKYVNFKDMVENYDNRLVHADVVKGSGNLMDLPSLDFIGWTMSTVCYLTNIHNRYNSPGNRKVWPKNNKHVLNYAHGDNLRSFFRNDPNDLLKRFSDNDYRMEIITQLRQFEVLMKSFILAENSSLAHKMTRAVRFIESLNKKKKFISGKRITETKDFYTGIENGLKAWENALIQQLRDKNKNKG
jgi:hypothetical protein